MKVYEGALQCMKAYVDALLCKKAYVDAMQVYNSVWRYITEFEDVWRCIAVYKGSCIAVYEGVLQCTVGKFRGGPHYLVAEHFFLSKPTQISIIRSHMAS